MMKRKCPLYEMCHCPNFRGWVVKRVVARFPHGGRQPYRKFTCKACGDDSRWLDLYGTPEINQIKKERVINMRKGRLYTPTND